MKKIILASGLAAIILIASLVGGVQAAPAAVTLTGTPTVTPTPAGSPTPTSSVPQNPVSALIASFFGLKPSVVDAYHQDGSGYGVIAQACWLSFEIKGDASLCGDILAAKKSGDYSAIPLPDGSIATNWGQFMKSAVNSSGGRHNLGSIVSGHASPILTLTPGTTTTPMPLNGNNGNNGNGHHFTVDKYHGRGKGPHK